MGVYLTMFALLLILRYIRLGYGNARRWLSVNRILLCQQGAAVASQVQRRIREQYGERHTVSRATRRILQTFIDWGVLAGGSDPGVHVAGQVLFITNPRLAAWLVEATLHASHNGQYPLKAVLDSPSWFPFTLERIPHGALTSSGQLEVIGYGLEMMRWLCFGIDKGTAITMLEDSRYRVVLTLSTYKPPLPLLFPTRREGVLQEAY